MKLFYQKYKPVIVFYFLACLFSWPFFFWRDVYSDSWNNLNIHIVLKLSLIMWGPGLSAIICSLLFRKQTVKSITFFGTSIIKSLLFWSIPMALFLTFGFKGYGGSYINLLFIWSALSSLHLEKNLAGVDFCKTNSTIYLSGNVISL